MGVMDALGLNRGEGVRDQYVSNRKNKGSKILLETSKYINIKGARVLDFGAGTGLIAKIILESVGREGRVVAADIEKKIRPYVEDAGVEFKKITDGGIDEKDDSFDLIVSNHVLEHVGEDGDKLEYLRECARLLGVDGLMYLATPNRWAVIEPHYRIPFLSWWPKGFRSVYLRFLGKFGVKSPLNQPMHEYATWPLSRREVQSTLGAAGFAATDITRSAAESLVRIELFGWRQKLILAAIPFLWWLFRPLAPTNVFICRHLNR